MSLFENEGYRWRETYFVLMNLHKRPTAESVEQAIKMLGGRFQIQAIHADDAGLFESLTLYAPGDNAAMDITFLSGEEVVEHSTELAVEIRRTEFEDELPDAAERIVECDARLDVYHFEQVDFFAVMDEDEEDELLDPASLLVILESLADLCEGIVIDPQSGSIL